MLPEASCHARLQGWSQHFQYVAAELRELIETKYTVVRQRGFSRHVDVSTGVQADIGDRVKGWAQGVRGDDGGAPTNQTGDAVDAGGFVGIRSGQTSEQRLGLPQVGSVEALGEPAVDRGQQLVGFGPLTLGLPQPGQAHGRYAVRRDGIDGMDPSSCTPKRVSVMMMVGGNHHPVRRRVHYATG